MVSVAVPGARGAFSHLAAAEVFANADFVFFPTFAEVLNALRTNKTDRAVLPVENSAAGRVMDVHNRLPKAQVHIVAEHFLRINHHLLGTKDAELKDVKTVVSHEQALAQCSVFLTNAGLKTRVCANTALAAKEVAQKADKSLAALASEEAARQNGLKILQKNVQNSAENRTRFLILSRTAVSCPQTARVITSLVFFVKNEPAALYHALGAFALNGINLLRLESYIDSKNFTSAGFFADIAVHVDAEKAQNALKLLKNLTQSLQILGTYPASSLRPEI